MAQWPRNLEELEGLEVKIAFPFSLIAVSPDDFAINDASRSPRCRRFECLNSRSEKAHSLLPSLINPFPSFHPTQYVVFDFLLRNQLPRPEPYAVRLLHPPQLCPVNTLHYYHYHRRVPVPCGSGVFTASLPKQDPSRVYHPHYPLPNA
jgi:hypothetical protein